MKQSKNQFLINLPIDAPGMLCLLKKNLTTYHTQATKENNVIAKRAHV